MQYEGDDQPMLQTIRKNRLLNACSFFLGLEERMLFEQRPKIAKWARRQYERYRTRLEAMKRHVGREPDHQR
jgi:hypothetical protein